MESVADFSTAYTGAVGHVLIPSVTQTLSAETWETYMFNLEQRNMFNLINVVLLGSIISVFGIISNIINMIVFYKQGLDTTINISFFAMAFSDLCCLTFQTWYIICFIPYFEQLKLPVVYLDVQFLVGGVPREMFARVTCFITAYVTAERCLCIAFPLRIKQLITPRRTTMIILILFLLPWTYGIPLFVVGYLDWQYYPDLNRTLLGVVVTEHKERVDGLAFVTHAISGVASLVAVVVFTFILIRKLGQTSAWRQSFKGNHEKADPMSKRDRATMRMVVLIAVILIVSYVPSVALGLVTFCEPEFVLLGKYCNMYLILWSFPLLFETSNSSVNIFLYYRMSTKFRRVFKEMFLVRRPRIKNACTLSVTLTSPV